MKKINKISFFFFVMFFCLSINIFASDIIFLANVLNFANTDSSNYRFSRASDSKEAMSVPTPNVSLFDGYVLWYGLDDSLFGHLYIPDDGKVQNGDDVIFIVDYMEGSGASRKGYYAVSATKNISDNFGNVFFPAVTVRPMEAPSVQTQDTKIIITWNIPVEDSVGTSNIIGYYVMRSIDNVNFTKIADNIIGNYYEDTSILSAQNYYYAIGYIYNYGLVSRAYSQSRSTVKEHYEPPKGGRYKAYAYPNPFSPASDEISTLVFPLKEDGEYEFILMNMLGRIVWKNTIDSNAEASLLIDSNRIAYYTNWWDGKNVFGKYVPNGVYLLMIMQNDKLIHRAKIAVLD